jgi:uncharacterized membrane protein
MSREEGFFSRHLWWMVLVVADAYILLSVPAWMHSFWTLIAGMTVLLLLNVLMVVEVLLYRPKGHRIQHRSQEFGAWEEWLLTGMFVSLTALELYYSPDINLKGLPDSQFSSLYWFWLATTAAVHYTNAWSPEDGIVEDERGKKIGLESMRIAFASMVVAAAASPLLLGLGSGAQQPVERTTLWFIVYFVNFGLFAYWLGRTYVIYRFACDRVQAWKLGSKET